jgi:hypothetical protein
MEALLSGNKNLNIVDKDRQLSISTANCYIIDNVGDIRYTYVYTSANIWRDILENLRDEYEKLSVSLIKGSNEL